MQGDGCTGARAAGSACCSPRDAPRSHHARGRRALTGMHCLHDVPRRVPHGRDPFPRGPLGDGAKGLAVGVRDPHHHAALLGLVPQVRARCRHHRGESLDLLRHYAQMQQRLSVHRRGRRAQQHRRPRPGAGDGPAGCSRWAHRQALAIRLDVFVEGRHGVAEQICGCRGRRQRSRGRARSGRPVVVLGRGGVSLVAFIPIVSLVFGLFFHLIVAQRAATRGQRSVVNCSGWCWLWRLVFARQWWLGCCRWWRRWRRRGWHGLRRGRGLCFRSRRG